MYPSGPRCWDLPWTMRRASTWTRRRSAEVLFDRSKALCDTLLSDAWTQNYLDLLGTSCSVVRERSFEQLARRTVEGRAL